MLAICNEYIVGLIQRIKQETGMQDEDIAQECGFSRMTLQKRKKNGMWRGNELAILATLGHVEVNDMYREVGTDDGGD